MEMLLKRIVQIRSLKGLSVRAFAQFIECNQVTVDRQLKGERSLSIETIMGVINHMPELSLEWLFRGEGSMLRTEPATISIGMNKVGNGSAVAIGNGASSSISDSEILKENARLREENKQLRERCDKLTDKLLGI